MLSPLSAYPSLCASPFRSILMLYMFRLSWKARAGLLSKGDRLKLFPTDSISVSQDADETRIHPVGIAFAVRYCARLLAVDFALLVLATAAKGIAVWLAKIFLDELTRSAEEGKSRDLTKIGWILTSQIILELFATFMKSEANLISNRVSVRLVNNILGLLFEKITRISIINSSSYSMGEITNIIQQDTMKLEMMARQLEELMLALINILTGFLIGILCFGFTFSILMIGYAVCFFVSKYIFKKMIIIENDWRTVADEKVKSIKEIISNIRFIKLESLENHFFFKICQIRAKELKRFVQLVKYLCVYVFGVETIQSATLWIFLFVHIQLNKSLTPGEALILNNSVNMIRFNFNVLGRTVSFFIDLGISFNRINKLLQTNEVHLPTRGSKKAMDSRNAIVIKNGSFFWGLPSDSQLENPQIMLEESALVSERSFTEPISGFDLKSIDFKARKGKLTAIIGKIGSGKSSLIYSILGETHSSTSELIKINGTIGYVGQNAWLINGSLKENILMGKEMDESLFQDAIKYSCLAQDITQFDQGVHHLVGEEGIILSGGQKIRLALARCIYHKYSSF